MLSGAESLSSIYEVPPLPDASLEWILLPAAGLFSGLMSGIIVKKGRLALTKFFLPAMTIIWTALLISEGLKHQDLAMITAGTLHAVGFLGGLVLGDNISN